MSTEVVVAALMGLGVGGLLGYALYRWRHNQLRAEWAARLNDLQEQSRRETEAARLKAQLDATNELSRLRANLEAELAAQRTQLLDSETRLRERENSLLRQLERIDSREEEIRKRMLDVEATQNALATEKVALKQLCQDSELRLVKISQLNPAEARAQLLHQLEQEVAKDAADLSHRMLDDARLRAEEQARRIIATAIQRYAGKHTFETTTATVSLSGDEIKGRIIGRDGRNIRAFESLTGITVLVDDTPNAVVLSGFDPIRRETARQAMERLILDGRIHPARIEEVVNAVNQEMDAFILRTGEQAFIQLGLPPAKPEVARALGKLHFRHSYSQNVLHHSIEVAHLCGLMAAEMNDDPHVAKRAGLLHDIGKGLTHELEGPHAIVGANFLKEHAEPPAVVNAVASHHGEVPYENIFGILVGAADAISASRPGSRSESLATYLKRLTTLEQIALEFDGVERAFALQAGRELRVVVRPEQMNDTAAYQLARSLAKRVEELNYPGQIRITVIRETRCVEFAK